MPPLIQIYLGLTHFQYLILFLLVIIEGPIATVLAGFLAAQGTMNPFIAYPVIVVADLVGDLFYYYLGKSGRGFGYKLLGKQKPKIENFEKHFKENTGKTILLGKLAHGVGVVVLFAAGVARVKMKDFLVYNTIGTIPKSAILLAVGYFFGNSYMRIARFFDLFGLVSLGIAVLLLILYIVFTKVLQKKEDL